MLDVRLYFLQRLSAILMAPLVITHLAVMIYAVQGGISAGEILSRTQGSFLWAAFYGLFVLAVATHAAIGLRVIVFEMTGLRGLRLDVLSWLVFAGLLLTGANAVFAVTFR